MKIMHKTPKYYGTYDFLTIPALIKMRRLEKFLRPSIIRIMTSFETLKKEMWGG